MNTKDTVTVGIASEYRVVGYNPENADMDRPRGEIVREVFFLVAEDARGARWVWGDGARDEATAEAAYRCFAPPVFLWSPWRPAYGSVAYMEDGGDEEMMAWEAGHREAESWGCDSRFYGAY